MSTAVPALRSVASSAIRRSSRTTIRTFSSSSTLLRQGPGAGGEFEQANDPQPRKLTPNVSKTNEKAITSFGVGDTPLQEMASEAEKMRVMQAPNRSTVWSRNQMPRDLAMSGPRFEQTIMELQPRPMAAVELIHQQPVRWVDSSVVACDGGGGPLGHPKIFINTDKPQINMCTYCGLPYANKFHKKFLESCPPENLPYPLKPSGRPGEVEMPHSPSMNGKIEGNYPELKGELMGEGSQNRPFSQR